MKDKTNLGDLLKSDSQNIVPVYLFIHLMHKFFFLESI